MKRGYEIKPFAPGVLSLYILDIKSCGAIEFADCSLCGGAGKVTVTAETFAFSYPF